MALPAPNHSALPRRIIGAAVAFVLAMAGIGLVADPALAVSGGGCKNTGGVRACISVWSGTTNPILSDFYVLNLNQGETRMDLYLNNNGTTCGHLAVNNPAVGGHYGPIACDGIGSGKAITVVSAGRGSTQIYNAVSPYLYFP